MNNVTWRLTAKQMTIATKLNIQFMAILVEYPYRLIDGGSGKQ